MNNKLICNYCSLTICNKCAVDNPCHYIDNLRTICNNHTKNNSNVNISIKRILCSKSDILDSIYHINMTNFVKDLCNKNINIYNNMFKNYYREFNNTAHFFNLYDINDTDLWKGIYF